MKSISLESEIEELTRLNEFIEEELLLNQYDIKLIVEEIFVNIVNYSKCSDIEIFFELNDKQLKMIFVDDGIKFNPLLKDDPEFPDKIEEAKIGGLGIHFVKTLADDIFYERIKGENHLTVIKSVENEK